MRAQHLVHLCAYHLDWSKFPWTLNDINLDACRARIFIPCKVQYILCAHTRRVMIYCISSNLMSAFLHVRCCFSIHMYVGLACPPSGFLYTFGVRHIPTLLWHRLCLHICILKWFIWLSKALVYVLFRAVANFY